MKKKDIFDRYIKIVFPQFIYAHTFHIIVYKFFLLTTNRLYKFQLH